MAKKVLSVILALLLLGSTILLAACEKTPPPVDEPTDDDILSSDKPTLSFTLLDDGTYSVSKGGLGYANEIVIPETYEGKPVTKIAASGFSGAICDKITIPASITEIGAGAFSGCTSITTIELPAAIEVIPTNAFSGCIYLESFTVPANVKEIGDSAFQGCTSLTTFTVPEGVTTLGANVFYNCKNMKSISLPSTLRSVGAMAFAVIGEDPETEPYELEYYERGELAFYELDGDLYLGNEQNPRVVLIKMGNAENTSYTVHSDTRVIYNYAFYDSALTSVTLHDNIGNIGARAFYSVSYLTSIHIPDSVTVIDEYAFAYCSRLITVTGMNKIVTIGDQVFRNCGNLKSLSIGSTLETIGVNVFSNAPALQLTVEGNISYIGNSENPHLILLRVTDKTQESYEIHEDTKIIYQSAFSYCNNLWEIEIPNNVFKIGHYAFYSCKALGSITLPDSVTVIEEYAFYGCSRLSSAVVPDSVTYIGTNTFGNCTNLTTITLPFVGQTASGAGSRLFGYIFGASSIAQHPTHVPSSLKNVILTSCTTIGTSAFSDCENIVSITLPSTLKVIEPSAFFFAKGLKRLYINDIAAWCNVDISVHNSSPMANGGTLYLNDKKVTDLVIPDTVTTIKPYTFYGCTSITSLTMGDSVTEIGDDAFANCTELATVTMGNGVKMIRSSAFENCKSMTELTLSQTLEVLDSSALRGCVLLESVVLPKTLTFIGDHAFKNCDALKSVTFKGKWNWCTSDSRTATDGDTIRVWSKSKNATNLTADYMEYYWIRK